jgi:hypothetical protein
VARGDEVLANVCREHQFRLPLAEIQHVSTSRLRVLVSALALVAGLFAVEPLKAQIEVGSLLQNGKVIVKIYATLDQAGMPYGRPIEHFALLLVSPSGERSAITTDETGTSALQLAPGAYRLASAKPLEQNGHFYVWDVALDVRPGMHALDLNQRNAGEVDANNARLALAPSGGPADALASAPASQIALKGAATPPPAYLYKSPGEAALFSFLIPGVGQMYNGQAGKGVALLLVSSGGLVVAATAAKSCGLYSCSRNTAPLVLGLGVSAVTWIASIIDAYGTANRLNAQRGFHVGAVPANPYLDVARNGATTVGLSLAIR